MYGLRFSVTGFWAWDVRLGVRGLGYRRKGLGFRAGLTLRSLSVEAAEMEAGRMAPTSV